MKKIKATCVLLLFIVCANAQQPAFDWAKAFAGTQIEMGRSVVVDNMGNVYSTGMFSGICDFDPGPGTFNLTQLFANDAYVSKLDSNGNFVWAIQLNATSGAEGIQMALDNSGNVIIVGTFNYIADFDPGPGVYNLTSTANSLDVFMLKLSPQGNFIWAKQFVGIGNDFINAIRLDNAGNIYTVGHFAVDSIDFDPGVGTHYVLPGGNGNAMFICKLDPMGNFNWVKTLYGTTTSSLITSIELDNANHILLCGYFNHTVDFDPGPNNYSITASGTFGDEDIFISQLDTSGNHIWTKNIGYWYKDFANDLICDANNNIYVTGSFSATVDFDPGSAINQLIGGGAYTLKLDLLGNFIWVIPIGGRAITTDAANNIFIAGEFQNTKDFDPGVGVYNLTSTAGDDVFILKINASGNFLWALNVAGNNTDQVASIFVKDGDIYTTGFFMGNTDFNPDTTVASVIINVGMQDIFVLKLSEPYLANLVSYYSNDGISFLPNPAHTYTKISGITEQCKLEILNIYGCVVASFCIDENNSEIDLHCLPGGNYILILATQSKYITKKFLKI